MINTETPPNPTIDFKGKLIAWLELTRFDKPVGTELLLYPTLWALFLAQLEQFALGQSSRVLPSWQMVLIFTAGAVLMRAAGCAINDFADRKVDGSVKRTNTRPLADGRLSPKTAVVTFIGLSLLSACLLFFLPVAVFYWAIVAVLLAFVYPFMKRYTHLPQVVLAAAFGWAIPMAFVAVSGTVSLLGWLLFGAYMCWTVAYDTQYALCDMDDDVKIGVKSTAILFHRLFGKNDIFVIVFLQFIFTLIMCGVFWYFKAYVLAVLAAFYAIAEFFYQYKKVATKERLLCFFAFRHNAWVGRMFFLFTLILCTLTHFYE